MARLAILHYNPKEIYNLCFIIEGIKGADYYIFLDHISDTNSL